MEKQDVLFWSIILIIIATIIISNTWEAVKRIELTQLQKENKELLKENKAYQDVFMLYESNECEFICHRNQTQVVKVS